MQVTLLSQRSREGADAKNRLVHERHTLGQCCQIGRVFKFYL